MAKKYESHQFNIFSYKEVNPKKKVPISAARIEAVKNLIERGNGDKAAIVLRSIRERLEEFESRL